jgi:hypothetical protein
VRHAANELSTGIDSTKTQFLTSKESSINFVDAAGVRPQDGAFVGLSNFPSFDRNHAGKERTHMSFGFFEDRRIHHIDTQSLGKFNCGSPNKTFQCARDGCTRDTGEDRFFIVIR